MELERFPKEEDKKYSLIYGGIAWPGKRPGFAVILGLRNEPAGFEMHQLDEVEAGDVREVVRACGGLDFYYRPEMWVGDNKDLAACKFIRELNDENRNVRPQKGHCVFKIARRSPMLDMQNDSAPQYFFPMLKEMLHRKKLILKDGSKLKGYMYGPENLQDLRLGDFPAIDALAFAAAELDRATKPPRGKKLANNRYDVLAL